MAAQCMTFGGATQMYRQPCIKTAIRLHTPTSGGCFRFNVQAAEIAVLICKGKSQYINTQWQMVAWSSIKLLQLKI